MFIKIFLGNNWNLIGWVYCVFLPFMYHIIWSTSQRLKHLKKLKRRWNRLCHIIFGVWIECLWKASRSMNKTCKYNATHDSSTLIKLSLTFIVKAKGWFCLWFLWSQLTMRLIHKMCLGKIPKAFSHYHQAAFRIKMIKCIMRVFHPFNLTSVLNIF